MFISSSPHYINTVNEKTDEERGRCYLVTLPRIAFKVIVCSDLFLLDVINYRTGGLGNVTNGRINSISGVRFLL